MRIFYFFFFFQAEDGIRDFHVTGVQTCALPISLSEEETARLLGALFGQPLLDAALQHALLSRAGGNPLYAEQYAAMALERGETENLPVPETLHGVIAALLDRLPADEKGLLQ